jgi:hypothetical protein
MNINEVVAGTISVDQWFGWAGQVASIGWIILVFFPRTIKPLLFIPQYFIPFCLGLLYAGLILNNYFISEGGYDSITNVRLLFSDDNMLLAGWIHYLAFDLFIGAWVAIKADKIGMSRLIQAPLLIAIFMFGPIGLVMFLFMKSFYMNISISQTDSELDIKTGESNV